METDTMETVMDKVSEGDLERLASHVEQLFHRLDVSDADARLDELAEALDATEAVLARETAVYDRSLDCLTAREEYGEPERHRFFRRFRRSTTNTTPQPSDITALRQALEQGVIRCNALLERLGTHRAACIAWLGPADVALIAKTRLHASQAEALDGLQARAARLFALPAIFDATPEMAEEGRSSAARISVRETERQRVRLSTDLTAAKDEFMRLDAMVIAGEAAIRRVYRHVELLDLAIVKLKIDIEKAVLHYHALSGGRLSKFSIATTGHAQASFEAMEAGRLAGHDIARRKNVADGALKRRLHPEAAEPENETRANDVTPAGDRES